MEDKYLRIVKKIILDNIDKDSYIVFLFGSRARKEARAVSDIDIGFYGKEPLLDTLSELKVLLEESIVPYHIDLVDFTQVDNVFKQIATERIEIWNQPKDISLDMMN